MSTATDILQRMYDERIAKMRKAGDDLLDGTYTGGLDRYLADTKKWRTEISVLGDALIAVRREEPEVDVDQLLRDAAEQFGVAMKRISDDMPD